MLTSIHLESQYNNFPLHFIVQCSFYFIMHSILMQLLFYSGFLHTRGLRPSLSIVLYIKAVLVALRN